MNIKTVTIIGANGTMGANVSAIFASFGNAKVYMVGRNINKVQAAVQKAVKAVRSDSIASHLIPADYSMLETCVEESDLVFESVSENLEIKKDIAKRISNYVKPDAVIATGTSGLSVTALAEVYPEQLRSRFFGVHMFNPPYNLTLCEVIATKYSDQSLLEELQNYLSRVLYRTAVLVKDAPAFLGNRIGFYFINRSVQYAEKYQYSGGIDYIDAIFGSFSGRSMAPLATADFVGLDVHKAIVENILENAPDYAANVFVLPEYVEKLIRDGKLGKKANEGLYKQKIYDNGLKRKLVYDITADTYRDVFQYKFPFAEKMKKAFHTGNYQQAFSELIENQSAEAKICVEFLLEYIIYALFTVREVAYDVHAADDVMATGFNWCPPLALAEAIGSVVDVKELVYERLDAAFLEKIRADDLLSVLEPSRYDYRTYFKSV